MTEHQTPALLALSEGKVLAISRLTDMRTPGVADAAIDCRIGGKPPAVIDGELMWPVRVFWSEPDQPSPFAEVRGGLAWDKSHERFVLRLAEMDASAAPALYAPDRVFKAMEDTALCVARLLELASAQGLEVRAINRLVPAAHEEELMAALIQAGVEPIEDDADAWSFDATDMVAGAVDRAAHEDIFLSDFTALAPGQHDTLSALTALTTVDSPPADLRLHVSRATPGGGSEGQWTFTAMWSDTAGRATAVVHAALDEETPKPAVKPAAGRKGGKPKKDPAAAATRSWQLRIERIEPDLPLPLHGIPEASCELMVAISRALPAGEQHSMVVCCRSMAGGPGFEKVLATWNARPTGEAPNAHGSLHRLPVVMEPPVRPARAAAAG